MARPGAVVFVLAMSKDFDAIGETQRDRDLEQRKQKSRLALPRVATSARPSQRFTRSLMARSLIPLEIECQLICLV